MKKEDAYYLGYIVKAVGTEGGLLAGFDTSDMERYEDLETVFILIEGKLVPFFIEDINIRPAAREAVIFFEDVDTVEKARELCAREIYLAPDVLPPSDRKTFQNQHVIGYQAYQSTGEHIGEIAKIMDFPGNPVFSIEKKGKEILIPAADELIDTINHEEKKIILTPPPGLLDLYQ